MDQLEMFREQLRRKPGDPRPTTQESPAQAETEKVKKKRKPLVQEMIKLFYKKHTEGKDFVQRMLKG